jgi:prevent-host-death family protein
MPKPRTPSGSQSTATTVTVHQAKTTLSELLRRVEAGEEIIIARGNTPVAVLKSCQIAETQKRRAAAFGCLARSSPVPTDAALIGPLSDAELIDAFGADFVDIVRTPSERKAIKAE